MIRGRALSWARLAHQQPLFHALERRHGAGAIACSEHLRLRWLRVHERVSKGGERRKKKNEMTTEHSRSNLGGAHGCMRLWVAVPESPTLLETLMPMSKLIHVHFGRANADEVGAREEGTCLSAHCDT